MFQSPSMRDVEQEGEEEAEVSCIFGVSGSSSESAHLPICFSSLDGVANTNPGLLVLSADASRSWSENAPTAAAAGEEDADDDGIGSRDGEDGTHGKHGTSADDDDDVAETWRCVAAASADGNGRSAGDSDWRASGAGESIARQLRGGETGEMGLWDSSHSRESPGDDGSAGTVELNE